MYGQCFISIAGREYKDNEWKTLGTLPVGYRPDREVNVTLYNAESCAKLQTNGLLRVGIVSGKTNGGFCYGYFSFICV